MNDNIESFSALMDLERTSTLFLTQKKWPNKRINNRWNNFINKLNSLSSDDNEFDDISAKKLEALQKLLDMFFTNGRNDITIITGSNKRNLPRIIASLTKLKVNNVYLDSPENETNLQKFLNKIPKEEYPRIETAFVKCYLNNEKFYKHKQNEDSIIELYLRKVLEYLKKKNLTELTDIELFFKYYYFQNKLEKKTGKNYNEVLEKIGVPSKYQTCLYFSSGFFYWIISLDEYSVDLLKSNKKFLNNLTDDEKKLLFARIILYFKHGYIYSNRDDQIRKIEQEFFAKEEVDKTEEGYWKIITAKYKTIGNKVVLNEAYRYYIGIFAKFIITRFFDCLDDVAKDYTGKTRAEFWRKYGTSEAFVNLKLVLNARQKRIIFDGLSKEEIRIFSKYCISNYSNGTTQAAVLILVFKTKTVAEFVQSGNSCQVFNTNDEFITRVLECTAVDNVKALNYYSSGTVFENSNGVGRIIHAGDSWIYKTEYFLKRNGIKPGSE